MGIGEAHQIHHALHRAILARAAMKGVEHHIGRGLGQFEGAFVSFLKRCQFIADPANNDFVRSKAGNPITQADPGGYPLYRLEWQGLGSLERRLRNCLSGTRTQAYAYGSPEFVDLELFLMWRWRGMKVETPAVRP